MLDFDGVELSDEVKEKLNTQVNSLIDSKISSVQEELAKVAENNSRLLDEKNAAREKERLSAEEAERSKLEAAAKNGDVESLTNSWQKKYDADTEALRVELSDLKSKNKQADLNRFAQGFVSQHVVDDAFSREAMQSEYTKRLDLREGKPVVLDADGNLTALSVDDLNKEFLTASKYKSHIIATKADGGGAAGGSKINGGAVDLSKMNKTELSLFARENPEQYQDWASRQH